MGKVDVLVMRAGPVDLTAACAYLVRPDGYVGYRQAPIDTARLVAHLGATFA